MRSGGSVLKAPPGAEEGALPREHRPQAVSRTLPTQLSFAACIGTEKALRYIGEPFLYGLELANLNLDGIAGMRNGGGPILKAPGPFTYWGAEEGALPREHCPSACCAELCREHRPRAGHAERGLRPQGAPAPQRGHSPASGNRCAAIGNRSPSPGSRAVPANATGDGA